jgi:predicted membrane protein
MAPVNTALISILGAGQFLMGLWLTLPFSSLPAYDLIFPPEWFIGIVLILIGGATTWFSINTKLKALQWSTTLAYIFWLVATIFMIAINITGMGWIAGLIFATYCFLINLNIRANRKNTPNKSFYK